jgi:hypothetical protein
MAKLRFPLVCELDWLVTGPVIAASNFTVAIDLF